jgi:hypothetical protein
MDDVRAEAIEKIVLEQSFFPQFVERPVRGGDDPTENRTGSWLPTGQNCRSCSTWSSLI